MVFPPQGDRMAKLCGNRVLRVWNPAHAIAERAPAVGDMLILEERSDLFIFESPGWRKR